MFKNSRIFATLAATLAVASAAFAQPAPKVVTVDRARAYNEYYKTIEFRDKLTKTSNEGKDELNQQQNHLKELADQIRKIEEEANNPALTKDARDRKIAERDRLYQNFQAGRDSMEQYAQNLDTTLQQRLNINQNLMLEEINKVVNDLGKAKGATLILDVSTDTVIYADAAYDITAAVIAELNKNAPKPAAPAAAAPATPAP